MAGSNENIAGKLMLLLALLAIGGIFYCIFLWGPLSGWILENIIIHLDFGISSPGIGGGLLLMLLALVTLVIIFVLPYIIFCGIVFLLWTWYQSNKS